MPTLLHRHTHTQTHNEDSLLITPKTNRHQRLVNQIKGRQHSSKTFSSFLIPFHPYDEAIDPPFGRIPFTPPAAAPRFVTCFQSSCWRIPVNRDQIFIIRKK